MHPLESFVFVFRLVTKLHHFLSAFSPSGFPFEAANYKVSSLPSFSVVSGPLAVVLSFPFFFSPLVKYTVRQSLSSVMKFLMWLVWLFQIATHSIDDKYKGTYLVRKDFLRVPLDWKSTWLLQLKWEALRILLTQHLLQPNRLFCGRHKKMPWQNDWLSECCTL